MTRRNNRSGFSGVYYERERDKWCAEVRVRRQSGSVRRRARFEGNEKGKRLAGAWVKRTRKELGIDA